MRGFTYPRYAWVTNGWYQNNWWTEEVNQEQIDCSDDELAEFLHRSLVLKMLPEHNDSNAPTDVRLVSIEQIHLVFCIIILYFFCIVLDFKHI